MKFRNIVLAAFVGAMVALGIFVNSVFLFVAGMSACGLMHLFHGHGEKEHVHQPKIEEQKTNGEDARAAV